jgi:cobalt-zinc-cadmium efflux system membrane fusion protein
MHVNKGEVIAVMEDQQYVQLQQDYLTTKYDLEYLEKEYFRQKELAAAKAASDKVFEQSKSNYLTQKTRLVALGEKLKLININPNTLSEFTLASRITILSPINGYVSSVKVNIGKYIQSSEILFELVNPEDIHLNMTVFEKDIRHLSIGQKVKTFTNSDPSTIYPCEIILIGQDVSVDRHIEVHCHFEKYDKSLIPGMYMNAIIESEAEMAEVIEESAIVSYAGKSYCFIELHKGAYKMVEVQTGLKQNSLLELLNPEAVKGFPVVTKGAYTLLMKLKNVEE